MNHSILVNAAKSSLLKGLFLDIETGVVAASDGVVAAAWKPKGEFIEAPVSINGSRTHNTLDTLVKLHDAETIGTMEIDLCVLMRALEAMMAKSDVDAPVRQVALSIKHPKQNMCVLEIIERSTSSNPGATLILMGVTSSSVSASSVLDILPRKPSQPDAGNTSEASNNAGATEAQS